VVVLAEIQPKNCFAEYQPKKISNIRKSAADLEEIIRRRGVVLTTIRRDKPRLHDNKFHTFHNQLFTGIRADMQCATIHKDIVHTVTGVVAQATVSH